MNEGSLARRLLIMIVAAAIFVVAVFLYDSYAPLLLGRSETADRVEEGDSGNGIAPTIGSQTAGCGPQNPYRSIEEAIKEPALVCELNLTGLELTVLPNEVERFVNLKNLTLGDNFISEFPSFVGNLSRLKRLDARSNLLISLPAEIGNLKNLRELNVTNNRLDNFPKEIGDLISLEVLKAFNNNISSLPDEIGNLTKLQHLSLHDNLLTSLPESITKLTSLEEIVLGNNRFSEEERDRIKNLLPRATVSFGTSPHPEK